jgi:glyoxylate reductase
MGRVLVTRSLIEGGTDPLLRAGHDVVYPEGDVAPAHDELVRLVPDFDGMVCHLTDPIDAPVLQAGSAGRLQAVANAAVGYDNIDVVTANALGITVCNTPGVLDDTTADLAFLLILAAARQSTEAEQILRDGRWHGWGFASNLARDVHGTTLGLVGFGRIGRACTCPSTRRPATSSAPPSWRG